MHYPSLPKRNRLRRRAARPQVELLEDRLLLDNNNGIPPALLPFTDGYLLDYPGPLPTLPSLQATGTGGLPAAFLDQFRPGVPAGPGPLGPAGPGTGADLDPGAQGPLAVTVQDYTFGDTAFTPTGFGGPVELTGRVYAPTDLSGGPRPLIVFLHGRHATTFQGTTAFLEWPPTGAHQPIPSYQGYDYLGNVLASWGYIVVSISANGINARDSSGDLGMSARAQLVQRQLDIWRDLSTGNGTVQPFGTAPFGTRFVGKVDLQNVGTMGHSRGGEGVVRNFILNQSLGSPYGIKAVFPLAPVDFARPVINGVPLGVILPANDGDVSDNQGVHFFDDARYNVPGDLAPKHTFQVIGANHNFYNTIWTPGLFPAGTADDGANAGGTRIPAAQERGTGLAIMAAFFRTYVGNATVPASTAFVPFLKGDVPPPPSAQVGDDKIRVSYQAPDSSAFRRDVNRLISPTGADLITNTLGGAVVQSQLSPYDLCGGNSPQPAQCLPTQATSRQPHTTPSAQSSLRGLSQLRLGWSNTTTAFWENQLPAGARDVSGFYALQFRAALNWNDARNPNIVPQDFTVSLTDGAGRSASTLVSDSARSLFYPQPGGSPLPKLFLNSVRIPLSIFAAGGVDLTDVRSIRFNFDRSSNGALMLTDLAFTDPATAYAGPFVTYYTPIAVAADSIAGPLPAAVAGPISSIRVTFNAPINPATFDASDVVSLTGPGGPISVSRVAVVPGKANREFDIVFPAQSTVGTYTVVLGPNISDAAGHLMDQNFNRTLGEASGDQATLTFRISQSTSVARIEVRDGTTVIPSGTGSVDFGTTTVGTAITKTFTIRNTAAATTPLSTGTLVLNPQVTLPAGFSLTGFEQTALVPTGSTTFTVRLTAAATGTFTGTVSFGTNDGTANPFTFTINGTVEGAALRVTDLTPTSTGFVARFNRALNPATLNLYDATPGGLGPADVTLTGPAGAVNGSLVLAPDNMAATFIATGGVLPAGSYAVRLRSGANGFVDTTGAQLDGNSDGTPGDDFTTSFTAAPPAVIVSIPDFMRGPGQPVDVPANSTGLPLRLSASAGVTSVSLTLHYDPALLNITAASVAPGLPAGAAVTLDTSTPGLAALVFTSPALASGVTEFVRLTANVPASAASSYALKNLLDLTDVLVNDGAVAAGDDDGLHVVGYFGDTSGNGTYSALDAQRALRVALGLDTGFTAYQLADPVIIADITGNGTINSTDATRILQEALGIHQAQIPLLPSPPLTITAAGPDPLLRIPRHFRGRPGSLVTVPVRLDFSEGLSSADLALSYDTDRLELVSVRRGRLTRDFDLFATNIDADAGTIAVGLGRSAGPIGDRGAGSILRLTFRIKADAPAGRAVVNLRESLGTMRTQVNEGAFDLNPDPSDTAGDVLDGVIRVLATDRAARRPLT
jgi:hypothetical protein